MPVSTSEESDSSTLQDIDAQSSTQRTNIQNEDDEDTVDDAAIVMIPPSPGTGFIDNIPVLKPTLSTSEKLDLAKPLFLPFMIPLFVVYFAEVRQPFFSCWHVAILMGFFFRNCWRVGNYVTLNSTPSILEYHLHCFIPCLTRKIIHCWLASSRSSVTVSAVSYDLSLNQCRTSSWLGHLAFICQIIPFGSLYIRWMISSFANLRVVNAYTDFAILLQWSLLDFRFLLPLKQRHLPRPAFAAAAHSLTINTSVYSPSSRYFRIYSANLHLDLRTSICNRSLCCSDSVGRLIWWDGLCECLP